MRQGLWIVFLVTACSFDTSFPAGPAPGGGTGGDEAGGPGKATTGDDDDDAEADDAGETFGESGDEPDDGAMTSGGLTTGPVTGTSTGSAEGEGDGTSTTSGGASETGEGTTGGVEVGWAERRLLSVVDEEHAGTLENVPVLVVLDDARIDYGLTRAGGVDLQFRTQDEALLPHEIERWDPQGRSYVWVRLPSIVDGSADFWMYYGNREADSVEDPAAVWSNGYVGVWHLAEQEEVGPPMLRDSKRRRSIEAERTSSLDVTSTASCSRSGCPIGSGPTVGFESSRGR